MKTMILAPSGTRSRISERKQPPDSRPDAQAAKFVERWTEHR